jgi:glycosyltransferase involved in cell wall biosynthesis
MGSEPGMAWNWIINLGKHCRLHVITEGEWKNEIEQAVKELLQGDNISFYFNPVSESIRKMCWNQGDWRFYKHYKAWQYSTLQIAREIIKKENIDIIHQLNMIGFREPGYLWQLNKPFIWGPIDAKEKFPVAYLKGASLKQKAIIHLKNRLTILQFKYSYRIKQAALNANVIFGASSESVVSINKYYNKEAILLNETGCYVKEKIKIRRKDNESITLLWVGKFDFRKQLHLALETMKLLKDKNVKLHIIGEDNNAEARAYKKQCKALGIEAQCKWYGKVNHAEVQNLMQQSDLLFFTSVAEGTPHVVLESISNNLPVLCFNTCGQGDSVDKNVGVKIELSTPIKSIKDFTNKIEYLNNNRDVLSKLSRNCVSRQHELSWDHKAQQMVSIYVNAINNKQ